MGVEPIFPEPTLQMRTCLGCQQRAHRSDLLRLVRSGAHGVLILDRTKTLPGRGAWLHPCQECWNQAKKKRAFFKAFKDNKISWQQLEAQSIFAAPTQ